MAEYVTRLDRFQLGDFPMVCVVTGQPAAGMVEVEARRGSAWPWFLMPASVVWFLLASRLNLDHSPTGLLPFAEGQEGALRRRNGLRVAHDRLIGVVIRGAHPGFVTSCRDHQSQQQEQRRRPG